MKTNQKPDKRIHIRKKVAGGTTGAVLGAVVGGPVGALVGGVLGTVVGSAAENGKLQALTATHKAGVRKPATKTKSAAKTLTRGSTPKAAQKTAVRKTAAVRSKRTAKR